MNDERCRPGTYEMWVSTHDVAHAPDESAAESRAVELLHQEGWRAMSVLEVKQVKTENGDDLFHVRIRGAVLEGDHPDGRYRHWGKRVG